jgi:hypothetical protein
MINARFSYHGWQIELIEEIRGYSFRCWRSGTNEGISDRLVYSSHEQALAVARQRADLESACLALLRFLNDLARDDGDALRDSILEYARVGSLF